MEINPELKEYKKLGLTTCPKCAPHKGDLNFRVDKSYRCRKCGYDSRDKVN